MSTKKKVDTEALSRRQKEIGKEIENLYNSINNKKNSNSEKLKEKVSELWNEFKTNHNFMITSKTKTTSYELKFVDDVVALKEGFLEAIDKKEKANEETSSKSEHEIKFNELCERQNVVNEKIRMLYYKFKSFDSKTDEFLEEMKNDLDVLWKEFKNNHSAILLLKHTNQSYETELVDNIVVLREEFLDELNEAIEDNKNPLPSVIIMEPDMPDTTLSTHDDNETPHFVDPDDVTQRSMEIFSLQNANTCRVCLTKQAVTLIPLITKNDGDRSVAELIQECAGINLEENQHFPQFVCTSCWDRLSEFHRLKKLCLDSDENLQNEFKTVMKLEEYNSYFISDELEEANNDDDEDDEEFEAMDVEMLDDRNRKQMKPGIGVGLECTCYICNLKFISLEKMFVHYSKKHKHKHKKLFLCPFPGCVRKGNRVILNPRTFHFHLQTHYDPFKVKCKLCNQKFLDEWTFRKHSYKHVPKNHLTCEYCQEKVWFKSNLEKHIKKFHRTPEPEKRARIVTSNQKPRRIASICYVCNESADSMEKVFVHLKAKHYKNGTFKCQQPGCRGMKFQNAKSFHFHLKSHFEPSIHKCLTCGKVFNDEWQFKKHCTQHKYRQSANFVLKRAEKAAALRKRRPEKPKKIKRIRKIPGTCYLCKENFDCLERVFKHMRETHNKNGVYRCYQQSCYGKKFRKARGFFYHLKSHFEPSNLKCKLCERVFSDELVYKNHKYKHMQLKLICDLCGKEISSKKNILRHIINVHTKNGVVVKKGPLEPGKLNYSTSEQKTKPFPNKIPSICYICSAQCDSLRGIYNHMEVHRVERIFTCPYGGQFGECRSKFLQSSSFYHHLKDHVENNVYKCEKCGKELKSRSSYSNHIYTCRSREECICDICGKSIWFKSNMLRHMVKVHKIGKLPPKNPRRKKKLKLVYRSYKKPRPPVIKPIIPEAPEFVEVSENIEPSVEVIDESSMETESGEIEVHSLLSEFKVESEFWQPTVCIKKEI